MKNHMYQLIRGKNVACIHEYHFGVLTRGYPFNVNDTARMLRCANVPGSMELATIDTTDTSVMRQSATPNNRVKTLTDNDNGLSGMKKQAKSHTGGY